MTWGHAQAALTRIRQLRHRARDRELGFLCRELVDDDDVRAVLNYVENHPLASIARTELQPREILVEYLWQQAQRQHERRILALLTIGHQLRAGDRDFGPRLGRLRRNGRHNLRTRLIDKLDPYQAGRRTRRETAAAVMGTDWLTAHRAALHDVIDVILEHKTDLLAAVVDTNRDHLDEALGVLATTVVDAKPSLSMMAALAYALFLLKGTDVTDPTLRDALATGQHLQQQHAVTMTQHTE